MNFFVNVGNEISLVDGEASSISIHHIHTYNQAFIITGLIKITLAISIHDIKIEGILKKIGNVCLLHKIIVVSCHKIDFSFVLRKNGNEILTKIAGECIAIICSAILIFIGDGIINISA